MVKRAKEYIEAGDIFQVVLSQQFRIPLQVDPFTIYRHLRLINPSPYLFFLRCEGAGADRLFAGDPGAGSRTGASTCARSPARGRAAARPRRTARSRPSCSPIPKERAEHLMLVDLGRNDVGRVARDRLGARSPSTRAVERYSHVMHIVSNVQARLRPGLDWLDLLRATFPAGTLSGAPKVRAMEIIDELETLRRGPYGGCVGYVDYSGNMDTAIAIRTHAREGRRDLPAQPARGIVADSDPEAEYQETINKGRALIEAIDMAREGID